MLKEYISRKIRESEELIIDLESDVKNRKKRKNELDKLIKILEDENNDGSEIFSPRNHRQQNLDKLKTYREELKRVSEEIENGLNRLNETKKKRAEYKSMLEETERIHREEEKYENINYQIKNDQSEEEQAEDPTEQQAGNDREFSEYIGRQKEQYSSEQRTGDDRNLSEYTGQQKRDPTEQQSGDDKKPGEEYTEYDKKIDEECTGQQARDETKWQAENQNGNQDEERKEVTENVQTEKRIEQQEKEERNAPETGHHLAENLIQPGKQAEESEKEQETVSNTMDDTKIIIQKSIEGIVKRIESEKERNSDQQGPKYEEKHPQVYGMNQAGKNNIFRELQKERGTGRNDPAGIEIKSGELIVLESERKKEKEFLEKVKKGLDLCFVYSGNRSKCRNELIKIKKMIESYISSIE